MIGLMVLVSAIIIIAKCAEMEGKSGTKWGFITFGICFLTSAIPIPIPFIGIVIGFVITFILLFSAKVISNKAG
jgi:hypothetical protein